MCGAGGTSLLKDLLGGGHNPGRCVFYMNSHLQFCMVSCLGMDGRPFADTMTIAKRKNHNCITYNMGCILSTFYYPVGCYLTRRCLVSILFCQHKKLMPLKPFDVSAEESFGLLCPGPELAPVLCHQYLFQ